MKLDTSKAYDWVEWDFLEAMMIRLGFDRQWVLQIIGCVRLVSFKIKVNGSDLECFFPQWSICQEDPLSLYLFLICVEGFISLLSRGKRNDLIQGVKAARLAPSITYLFFVDDSLIFMKANENNCREFRRLLKIYETSSGQKINFEKSTLCFSPNCSQVTIDHIKGLLHIQKIAFNETYLGLPTMVRRHKIIPLNLLRNRCGKSFKGGGRSYYQRWGRRSKLN